MKDFIYLKPTTLKEAFEILDNQDSIVIYNGGTDVMVRIHDGLLDVKSIMDIKSIPGLKQISYDDKEGLKIGALVTLNEICQNHIVSRQYPLLAEAAHSIGSMQIRNRATLMGNICNASPLADTAPVLLATGSRIIAAGKGYTREIPTEEFFTGVRKTSLKQGEIAVEVIIPPAAKGVKGVFLKHSRRKDVDLSSVNIAMVVEGNNAKVALGAVAPTPIRAYNVEKLIKEKGWALDIIDEAKTLIEVDISPISDIRSSKEYRIEISKVLLARAIEILIDKDM